MKNIEHNRVVEETEQEHYQTPFGVKIVEMNESHLQEVLLIADKSFLSFWKSDDYKEAIAGMSGAFFSVACLSDKVIGFVAARTVFQTVCRNETELEIYNIAVEHNFRRHGIGRLLLDDLFNSIEGFRRAVVWLEVRESNEAAINFYRANDFEVLSRRKQFYRMPNEDALVMKRETGGAPRNLLPE